MWPNFLLLRARLPFAGGVAPALASLAVPVQDLLTTDPRQLAGYRVLGRLGTGGMGVVYLAVPADGRLVALKVVRGDLAGDPAFRARFRREVEMARRVSGLCTAPVLGADVDGPTPFVATAYIQGPTLAEEVRDGGPLDERRLVALAGGLASALADIHAAGVVHRDLKPANVILAPDGPKVIDFGIAATADADVTSLTVTGTLVGSPGWMAPEQASAGLVGPAADVFVWGSTVAFAATGRPPFGEGRTEAVVYRIVYEPPDLDGVPAALRPLVEAAMAKDPTERPTARDLLARVTGGRGSASDDLTTLLDRTWTLRRPTADDAEEVRAVPVTNVRAEPMEDEPVAPAPAPTPVEPVPVAPAPASVRPAPAPTPVAAAPTRRTWPVRALAVVTVLAVVAAIVVAFNVLSHHDKGGGATATSSTTAAAASTGPITPKSLVIRTPPNGAYSVKLPASWRLQDLGPQGDHTTHVWSDPGDGRRKLQVVVSTCAACVSDPANPATVHPENVLPAGTKSSFRINATSLGFLASAADNPNPDNGVAVVTRAGNAVTGFATADLFLPNAEHSAATAILNSFTVNS